MNEENKPKKVLIVDDDQTICGVLKDKLEQDGYEVDLAHTGDAGLEHIISFVPDMVLLDIRMPSLSGTELLEKYNISNPEHPPRFIIITNHDNMENISKVLKHGTADILSKASSSVDDIVSLVNSRLKD